MTLSLTNIDLRHMRTALALARRGLGNVWPNPSVGCVLVREDLDGRIVGRGWTQPGGRPHAETEALRRASKLAQGATAYVTLEPCSHIGKTEPCAVALLEAGISRVVASMADPDPRVEGKGLLQLKAAGIEVSEGLLKLEAEELNAGFISKNKVGRPLVTLKVATTIDGYVASRTGNSQWITGIQARSHGHIVRARHDAILSGIGTIEADNPLLTCRVNGLEHLSPIRVIMDTHGRLASGSAIVMSADKVPVWRYRGASRAPLMALPKVDDIPSPVGPDGRLMIAGIISDLVDRGITRLLVEAGPKLTTAFLKSGYVDRIHWYRSSGIMGEDGKAVINSLEIERLANLKKFHRLNTLPLGPDNLEIYTRLC